MIDLSFSDRTYSGVKIELIGEKIRNSNCTEWGTIHREIARVISKSDKHKVQGWFETMSTISPLSVWHEVHLLINRIYKEIWTENWHLKNSSEQAHL